MSEVRREKAKKAVEAAYSKLNNLGLDGHDYSIEENPKVELTKQGAWVTVQLYVDLTGK